MQKHNLVPFFSCSVPTCSKERASMTLTCQLHLSLVRQLTMIPYLHCHRIFVTIHGNIRGYVCNDEMFFIKL